jgi:hypothetical protein
MGVADVIDLLLSVEVYLLKKWTEARAKRHRNTCETISNGQRITSAASPGLE